MAHDPVVFISSTFDDLKDHREQAERAAQASGFSPRMMEYFPASGERPSLQVCLEKVSEAEVVVVLVAHRYGWVPDDPANPDAKSITWLECDHARNVMGKEVLAFLVDPDHAWPAELYENYRLVKERNRPRAEYQKVMREVKRNEKKLAQFKNELSRYPRKPFTDPASIRALVSEALSDWAKRHHPTAASVRLHDPEKYLKLLEDDTRQIRIKGLRTKRAEPYFFGIDEIYIPLTTPSGPHVPAGQKSRRHTPDAGGQRRMLLEQALTERRVVIIGDPGSGKSTFLRRVAFELCRVLRGSRPQTAPSFLVAGDRRFPILVRVADLGKLLAADHSPKPDDAPDWIPYFLGKQSEAYKWGLSEAFFQEKLGHGGCLLMVDGLDEAPERRMRERMARIFENATRAFPRCDFLVSTRPQTYEEGSVLDGFHKVRIGELERDEIRTFFDHFARALALNDSESKAFQQELETALASRMEIREMASNPVMLTALAVLQHNDERLPEYRVQLYGSILGWLAAAREHVHDRPAEECLKTMRRLALHMQDAPEGRRLVQINKRSAAEFIARELGGAVDDNEVLLERETQESGIIASSGNELKFWHLSFQEYLAAREIAGLGEADQQQKLFEGERLYLPEWRETMRLLGGLLCLQGEAKVEGLFRAILERLGRKASFPHQVRCAALLSAMMRDLSRMKYQPKTPDYENVVKAVMGIFETGEAEKIEIRRRIEAADLLGQVGDPRLEDDNWVPVPGGTFWMGAQKQEKNGRNYDPGAYDNEMPVHQVTLKSFRIRRYPVTVQEFGAFIEAKGYETPKYWVEGYGQLKEPKGWEQQIQYPNRPVVGVSWFEAAAWCAWAGGRLPTEAEWERAARGPQGGRYPWGNDPPLDPTRANYGSDVGHPTPVGLYPKGRTAEGLCDMLGNVFEWCQDWYGPYRANATGRKGGDERVLRGGSWYNLPVLARVSYRYGNEPTYRNLLIGFRCAGNRVKSLAF